MRKFFNTLTAVALALAASVSLTACDDDDDDPIDPTATLQSAVWEIDGYASEEAAKIFDYEVTITLPNGDVEKLSGVTLGKATIGTVSAKDLEMPATFAMTVTRTVKPSYTYQEGDKASWTEDFELKLKLLGENGVIICSRSTGDEVSVKDVDLANYLPAKGNKTSTLTLTAEKTSDGYVITN